MAPARSGVAVIEEIIKSILCVCSAGIKPAKSVFWISTGTPRYCPRALAKSTLTPAGLPCWSVISNGGKANSIPTINRLFGCFPQPAGRPAAITEHNPRKRKTRYFMRESLATNVACSPKGEKASRALLCGRFHPCGLHSQSYHLLRDEPRLSLLRPPWTDTKRRPTVGVQPPAGS